MSTRSVQVGRAGRDGQEAQCHLFLDDADFRRLHSLSSSDSVAASSVCAFLEEAFQAAEESAPAAEHGAEPAGQSYGVAVLAAQQLSRSMDLKMEVMETLLSYLEVSTCTLACMPALHASALYSAPALCPCLHEGILAHSAQPACRQQTSAASQHAPADSAHLAGT